MSFHECWYSSAGISRLCELISSTSNLRGLNIEIGCWEGLSTVAIANTCFPENLICVDTWMGSLSEGSDHITVSICKKRDVFSTFISNMDRMTAGNYVVAKFDCIDWLETYWKCNDVPVKFCHIDAAHDYPSVRRTIELIKPHVTVGGILCGDDFINSQPFKDGGVPRAVAETLQDYTTEGNLWIWKNV